MMYFEISASSRRGRSRQTCQPYDFRRPDRIAKDQLRAIHLLHENFARSLASSLSAYLRAYVAVNLVSVEQLSFMEFSQCLPSPTCLVSLGMEPFEGNAVLEMNPALVFPIFEMLLGGARERSLKVNREITEIEQSVLDGLFRIILHDLKTAWHAVSAAGICHRLARNRAAAAPDSGAQRSRGRGQHGSAHRRQLRNDEHRHSLHRRQDAAQQIRPAVVGAQEPIHRTGTGSHSAPDPHLALARQPSRGPTLSVADLMDLKEDDVLAFDYPVGRLLDLPINGKHKFAGHVVTTGNKRGFQIEQPVKL